MKGKLNMTFYEIIEILASHHVKFKNGGYSDLLHFNQFKRRISNGKIVLMDDGKIIPQTLKLKYGLEFELTEDMELMPASENPYEKLEELYEEFKYSVPAPYSDYGKSNFISVKYNNLNHTQMLFGTPRELARARLEAFVMFAEFPWTNEKHHYWQSPKDGDLILFKEWRKGL